MTAWLRGSPTLHGGEANSAFLYFCCRQAVNQDCLPHQSLPKFGQDVAAFVVNSVPEDCIRKDYGLRLEKLMVTQAYV